MEIKQTIEEFISFVLYGKPESEDVKKLIQHLDKLALLPNKIQFTFDELDYSDPPDKQYTETYKKVVKRFPNLGSYNTLNFISENIGNSEVLVGDAIDDITDIVNDLQDVLWYFKNTSIDDALWNLEDSFNSHWGRHLRELQLYLHDISR